MDPEEDENYFSDDPLEILIEYRIPDVVGKKLLNGGELIKSVCSKVYKNLASEEVNFDSKARQFDKVLESLFGIPGYEHMIYTAFDFLFWLQSLKDDERHRFEKSDWTTKHVLHYLHKRIEGDNGHVTKLISAQLEDQVMLCRYDEMIDILLPTKLYKEVKSVFCCSNVFFRYLSNHLFKNMTTNTAHMIIWIKQLDVYGFMPKFPVDQVVFFAITRDVTGELLSLLESEPTGKLARDVVAFMDSNVGTFYLTVDPERDVSTYENSGEFVELRKVEKKMVDLALDYRIRFNLDLSTVKNSVFTRQMNAFTHVHRKYREGSDEITRDNFYQRIIHIASQGGKRVQHAILIFLCNKDEVEHAVILALMMNIPQSEWPRVMSPSKSEVDSAKETLASTNQKIQGEQMEISNGFNLYKPGKGDHRVHLIDSRQAVNITLKHFIEDPANEFFGIDAEWDMSFTGEKGTVCLIQLSGIRETMLIDIHTFRTKWSEARLKKLFTLIFCHSKPIYGFDMISDISIISHNYPFFKEEILPRLGNLCCLYDTYKTIKSDDDLSNAVFGEHVPSSLNLASLSVAILGIPLGKNEQMSVWSTRPLRKAQQHYAARDSFAVAEIVLEIFKRINEKCPTKLNVAFVPWEFKRVEKDTANDEEDHNKHRTKSSHFKQAELVETVKEVNTQLQKRGVSQFTDLKNLKYLADTMVAPLGQCLRRVGVNVLSGKDQSHVLDQAIKDKNLRIITSGRACKKYQISGGASDRIIDVSSTLSLDRQLSMFLMQEKIMLDPSKIEINKLTHEELMDVIKIVNKKLHDCRDYCVPEGLKYVADTTVGSMGQHLRQLGMNVVFGSDYVDALEQATAIGAKALTCVKDKTVYSGCFPDPKKVVVVEDVHLKQQLIGFLIGERIKLDASRIQL